MHERVLSLAALAWAAPGKDPGFTPLSLLTLLQRRGKYHPHDFARLQLAEPFELVPAKETWLSALAATERFARERPPEESGCLYYSLRSERFVMPPADLSLPEQGIVAHFGAPSGVLPRVAGERIEGSPLNLEAPEV